MARVLVVRAFTKVIRHAIGGVRCQSGEGAVEDGLLTDGIEAEAPGAVVVVAGYGQTGGHQRGNICCQYVLIIPTCLVFYILFKCVSGIAVNQCGGDV